MMEGSSCRSVARSVEGGRPNKERAVEGGRRGAHRGKRRQCVGGEGLVGTEARMAPVGGAQPTQRCATTALLTACIARGRKLPPRQGARHAPPPGSISNNRLRLTECAAGPLLPPPGPGTRSTGPAAWGSCAAHPQTATAPALQGGSSSRLVHVCD